MTTPDTGEIKLGDKVYYLYTGKDGTLIKFPAIVRALVSDGILIRVGRYDVHTGKINTFESVYPKPLCMRARFPATTKTN